MIRYSQIFTSIGIPPPAKKAPLRFRPVPRSVQPRSLQFARRLDFPAERTISCSLTRVVYEPGHRALSARRRFYGKNDTAVGDRRFRERKPSCYPHERMPFSLMFRFRSRPSYVSVGKQHCLATDLRTRDRAEEQ